MAERGTQLFLPKASKPVHTCAFQKPRLPACPPACPPAFRFHADQLSFLIGSLHTEVKTRKMKLRPTLWVSSGPQAGEHSADNRTRSLRGACRPPRVRLTTLLACTTAFRGDSNPRAPSIASPVRCSVEREPYLPCFRLFIRTIASSRCRKALPGLSCALHASARP